LITIQADLLPGGGRGAIPESNEIGNNFVAIWYNASANQTASVKPDLVIALVTFTNYTQPVPDPVTGEPREGRILVITITISNLGLTPAGAFDVGVAAGIFTNSTRVLSVGANSSVEANLTFGPYLANEVLPIRAEVDSNSEVDEGNEGNNVYSGEADVFVTPRPPQERPWWVLALIAVAALALVAISVWGARALFKPEPEESVGAASAPSASPSPPVAESNKAPAPQPDLGQAPAPPPGQAAPWPPQQGPFPPATFYPPTQPSYPSALSQVASAPRPAGPPTLCPRCGSPQISYALYPVRQVICSNCRSTTLY
jgi:hypothetical protein